MDLKSFISKTLSEIQAGVQEAIHTARDEKLEGAINPVWGGPDQTGAQHVQRVQFDIAVTVSDTKEDGAGGDIKVLGIGVGAKATATTETSNVSRIQFTIPIIPPTTSIMTEQ